jgi:two-component system response regulator FlrC
VILDTLTRFSGNRKNTAEKLGISPRTLRYKLAKLKEEGVAIP